ncbi:MAG TPA: PKD domain-containing protein [Vicinamibacteria bacterium]|jgi:hypothetical protein|nr:PKD domain-containing protein [Vicinamibacteria bacterium]
MRKILGCGTAIALPVLAGLADCHKSTPTAPTLSATCSANPSSGPAPLAVSFTLNVAGSQGSFTVAIDYGDGSTGSNPNAPHTYNGAGMFTASFAVSEASRSARCSTTVSVSAPLPPPNEPAVAVFKTTPPASSRDVITGVAPLLVQFTMCGSHDLDGDNLFFTMDFLGDGHQEVHGPTGANCRRNYTYPVGLFSPQLCVTDAGQDFALLHPFQCKTYTVRVVP